MLGEKVKEIAKTCDGKVIDLIASGYNKEVLPHAWLALISGLADFKIETKEIVEIPKRFTMDSTLEHTEKVIQDVKKNLKDYWKAF